MSIKSLLSIIGLFCCCAFPAMANEFQPIGFESIGMGGAGVACARGSMSPYYNPALLARHRYTAEFDAGVGTGVREYNLAEQIDTLASDKLTDTLDHIANNVLVPQLNSPADRENILSAQQVLGELSTGDHRLSLMPTAGTGVQVGRFGFGAYGTSDGTARPVVDGTRLDLIIKQTVGGIDGYYAYDAAANTYSLTTPE